MTQNEILLHLLLSIILIVFCRYQYKIWLIKHKQEDEIERQRKIEKLFWDNLRDHDFNKN